MATNMNLPRKEYVASNMPMEYNSMAMNKTTSPNFAANMPLSQNAIGDAVMGNQGPSPFPPNHFNQGMNNFGGQSRQFQDNLENFPRMKYHTSSNMAAGGPSIYINLFLIRDFQRTSQTDMINTHSSNIYV